MATATQSKPQVLRSFERWCDDRILVTRISSVTGGQRRPGVVFEAGQMWLHYNPATNRVTKSEARLSVKFDSPAALNQYIKQRHTTQLLDPSYKGL